MGTTQGGETSLNAVVGNYAPCPEPQTRLGVAIFSTSAGVEVAAQAYGEVEAFSPMQRPRTAHT